MEDNHETELASAVEDRGSYPLKHSYDAAAESVDETVDQMDPVGTTNSESSDALYDEPNEMKATEDMFVDCPDEIEISESQQISEEKENVEDDQVDESDSGFKAQHLMAEIERLRDMHEKSVSEKERLEQEYEKERTTLARELTHLCDQLKTLNKQKNYAGENDDGFIDHLRSTSLHDIINECSRVVKNASDESFQSDSALLRIEDDVNRILAFLSTFFGQEELLNGSFSEKVSNIERSVNFLVERYNFFNYETHQLRGYMNELGYAAETLDEVGTFSVLRESFLELKRKEENLIQNINNLDDENRKLVEKLEEQRSDVENAKKEMGRLSAEVEQEKIRCASAKEKLGMAVTKGKALVQQRDSLKQLLSEQTSNLEKISNELQEKSIALEAAEQTQKLLAESEKNAASLLESLTQKDLVLQQCGEILFDTVENLEPTDITDKLRLVVDENNVLRATSLLFHKLSDVLSTFDDFPETLSSNELDVRVSWLVDSFNALKGEAVKFQSEMAKVEQTAKEEIDHLTSSLLAENQEKVYLESEVDELRNKCDAQERIQNELTEVRESFEKEIHNLTMSLLAESQEKNNLMSELEDLRHKYEEIISLVRDKILNVVLDASEQKNDDENINHLEDSDVISIIERCLSKIGERSNSSELSQLDFESLEKLQSLLYVTDQELSLHKLIIEESVSDTLKVKHLSDELKTKCLELNALNDEKDKLEERCSSVKEKLSMAIKKGKGLHQERENLKGVLNEKKAEVDRLKSELQQSLHTNNERQDQIAKLLHDLERFSQVEADFSVAKEHAEHLEQLLAERNIMLQKVLESIEVITTPVDLVFEQPVDKVNWLSRYISECETTKVEIEQELKKTKDESTSLSNELLELHEVKKSLEDALSVAKINMSRFLDEKKELELSKEQLEMELQTIKMEISSHRSELEEVLASKRELEEALSLAERNISRVASERDIAEESRILAEEQLLKLKEEFSVLITKLTDAEKTIRSLEDLQSESQKSFSLEHKKSLEDALSVAEINVSHLLSEKKELELSRAQHEKELHKELEEVSAKLEEILDGKRELEVALSLAEKNISRLMNERDIAEESRVLSEEQLQKLKEEFSIHITKLSDYESTIRSLEESLFEAQKNVSMLGEEKIQRTGMESEMKKLKEEADLFNNKLSAASLTIKSLEEALSNSQNVAENLVLEKNIAEQEILTLKSKLESSTQEIAGTRGILDSMSLELSDQVSRLHLLLNDKAALSLLEQCFEKTFGTLSDMESLIKELGNSLLEMGSDAILYDPVIEDESSVSIALPSNSFFDLSNDAMNSVDNENIVSRIQKINEGFHLKGKMLTDQFSNFATDMDKSVLALSRRLLVTKNGISSVVKHTKSLEQQVKDIVTDNQRQQANIASMENDIKILSSACIDAVKEMESDARSSILALSSVHKLLNLDDKTFADIAEFKSDDESTFADNHVKMAEKLVFATRRNHDISELFQDALYQSRTMIEDVHNKFEKAQLSLDEISGERDLHKDRISNLETDLEEQHKLCREMSLKLHGYQEEADNFGKRGDELSTSLSKFTELENSPLSTSQVKSILDKMNDIEIPDGDLSIRDTDDSSDIRKLMYVIDNFNAYLKKIGSLSHEKEELKSNIDELILETERLKKQVENHTDKAENLEVTENLLEIESALKNIIHKLGGNNLINDHKGYGAMSTLYLLDNLVMGVMQESESLRSRNEELGNKLLGTQKVVDDLSRKVELLEDSVQSRTVAQEVNHERGTTSFASLPTNSEISEVQDMGKSNNIPLVPSAAHVRTLRKGSSEHLALNIDSDSELLINNSKDSDEDKGHAFKSLNTSGLIPRQGRAVADRVDGIWVSASRALMSHPRGRLGVIAYWLLLHVWLLGSIL